LRLLQI